MMVSLGKDDACNLRLTIIPHIDASQVVGHGNCCGKRFLVKAGNSAKAMY
jgi:hypothetical protein